MKAAAIERGEADEESEDVKSHRGRHIRGREG